jgi:hypothetical protein
VKLRLADPPLDAIAKLLQRFGHGEEHLLSHLKVCWCRRCRCCCWQRPC